MRSGADRYPFDGFVPDGILLGLTFGADTKSMGWHSSSSFNPAEAVIHEDNVSCGVREAAGQRIAQPAAWVALEVIHIDSIGMGATYGLMAILRFPCFSAVDKFFPVLESWMSVSVIFSEIINTDKTSIAPSNGQNGRHSKMLIRLTSI